MSSYPIMTYTGGCHCGRIRFEVTGELARVTDCNCSICSMSGFLHWYVNAEQVRFLTAQTDLSTYVWHTRQAKHHFCPVCGVAPLRNPRKDPSQMSVNARCLDNIDLSKLEVEPWDGRNLH